MNRSLCSQFYDQTKQLQFNLPTHVFRISGLRRLIFSFLKTGAELRKIYVQSHILFPEITLYYDSTNRILLKERTITRFTKNKKYRKYSGIIRNEKGENIEITPETFSTQMNGDIKWNVIYNKFKYTIFEDLINKGHYDISKKDAWGIHGYL